MHLLTCTHLRRRGLTAARLVCLEWSSTGSTSRVIDYQINIYQGEQQLDRTVRIKVNKESKKMQLNMDLAVVHKEIGGDCHCKGDHDSGELKWLHKDTLCSTFLKEQVATESQ